MVTERLTIYVCIGNVGVLRKHIFAIRIAARTVTENLLLNKMRCLCRHNDGVFFVINEKTQ